MMRKVKHFIFPYFFVFLTSFFPFKSTAEEGMWLPLLLQQLNEADMQSKGLKISAEDIFSLNKTSLKDAVLLFGGGCTGEVISDEGLILTNHHCGYSQVQSLSSIEHNYLKDGYWAMNKSQELPCPGLTVSFIVSMKDVTKDVTDKLNPGMTEHQRDSVIAAVSGALEKEAVKGTHYEARVKSFYYGNAFYLFISETFKDIRLAGVPPESIGKFGGETDNWMWPRHNGDFSLFRIYADSANKPAKYAASNKPFKPRNFLKINITGVKEGDFTMVYGFPGRTTEYIPSAAVKMIINETDPNRVLVREKRLEIISDAMHLNDTIRLMYSGKSSGIANAYKKWKGEVIGLKKYDAVEKKEEFEKQFSQWVNADEGRKKEYGSLLSEFESLYKELSPYSRLNDFTTEAAFGIELLKYANGFRPFVQLCQDASASDSLIHKAALKQIEDSKVFFKNYYLPADRKAFVAMLELFRASIPFAMQPDYFKMIDSKYKGDLTRYADDVYSKSNFATQARVDALFSGFKRKGSKKIINDPAYLLAIAFADNYNEKAAVDFNRLNMKINLLQRAYMKAQLEMESGKNLFPDANLTLRLAYGNVKSYKPRDGVLYSHYSTLAGLIEKHAAEPLNDEFFFPARLQELFDKKDFGRYGLNGEMPLAFVASNHTTGGNSGSPVLNGKGELIGINFDRCWEGTMSDIMYDAAICRNISVDMRYLLFIVDKFAGARNLVDEMNIIAN